MHPKRHTAGLASLVLLVVTPAASQQVRRVPPPDNLEVQVVAEEGVPTIPFETVNNHIVMEMEINGSGPFRTVLDTGMPAPGVVLYGSDRVDALKLDYDSAMQAAVGGAGGKGERLTAQVVPDQKASLPGLEMSGVSLTVLPRMPDFAAYHDAIIGAALFRNFAVEIDPDAGVIRLHDPATFEPPEGAISLPLEIRRGIPFTTLSVTTLAGDTVPVVLAVDLGASHPVSLNAGTVEGLEVPPGAVETVIGRGISGDVRGRVGRVAAVMLGNVKLENVIATFPVGDHQSPRGMDSRNGNLGSGILGRFAVTFDYAHDRMVLVPGRRLREPFEHDMSGLVLRNGDDGLPVQEVIPGSPGDQAGLRAGDLVVEVNGTPAASLGAYGLRDLFRQEGARVDLVFRRGEERHEVTLTLRRLV
ncbi:MAG: aspartyl protease family protein [Acidobacteriota bacterium]|jgi:hypothetical protein